MSASTTRVVRDHDVPDGQCLGCGEALSAALGIGHHFRPTEGSVTMCVACGHLMLFRADLSLRNPDYDELLDILADERVQRMLAAQALTVDTPRRH